MRTKVTINLSTDDPLEAEILDLLSTIQSSHRKQERLRSFLKAGYNLFSKNMSPDQAVMNAFEQHDVALILSLFGQKAAPQAPLQTQPSSSPQYSPPSPPSAAPARIERGGAVEVQPPTNQEIDNSPVTVQPPRRKAYKQITGVLDAPLPLASDEEFLDVDPSILEPVEIPAPPVRNPGLVDPLMRLMMKK